MNRATQFTSKEYSAMLTHLQLAQSKLKDLSEALEALQEKDKEPIHSQIVKAEIYLDGCFQWMIGQKYEGMPGHILDDSSTLIIPDTLPDSLWRGKMNEKKKATIVNVCEHENDAVNHPSHYTDGGIETIDYIRAKLTQEEFNGYCKGNALKYISRCGKKSENWQEDRDKAIVYLKWMY